MLPLSKEEWKYGFWEGIESVLKMLFSLVVFLLIIFSPIIWICTDDTKILISDIKHKDFAIDYVPLFSFDIYRKFKIDKETYRLCENQKYSPACFSIANEYEIHDNRSRSEYYLEKIIDNEVDKCRLNSNIFACENIVRAYKKLGNSKKVKEYKNLIDTITEQRGF